MLNYLKKNKKEVSVSFLIIFLFYPKLAVMLFLIVIVNLPFRSLLKQAKAKWKKLYKILEEA